MNEQQATDMVFNMKEMNIKMDKLITLMKSISKNMGN